MFTKWIVPLFSKNSPTLHLGKGFKTCITVTARGSLSPQWHLWNLALIHHLVFTWHCLVMVTGQRGNPGYSSLGLFPVDWLLLMQLSSDSIVWRKLIWVVWVTFFISPSLWVQLHRTPTNRASRNINSFSFFFLCCSVDLIMWFM